MSKDKDKDFFTIRRISTGDLCCVHNTVRNGVVVKAELHNIEDAIEKGILPEYVSKHNFKKD